MNITAVISSQASASEKADFILSLYQQYGDADYIGEPVSQLEHMCQCAILAEQAGCSEEIILAALFHDLGHFCEHLQAVSQMDGFGVVDHEKLGADFLQSLGFSLTITSLVRNHVQAKRYLTFRFPDYYQNLSDASKRTLTFQGGIMSAGEAIQFESDPLFEFHIKLRQWDEQAKHQGQPVPAPGKYREMIIDHLESKTVSNITY